MVIKPIQHSELDKGIAAAEIGSPSFMRSDRFKFPQFGDALTISPSQVLTGMRCMKQLMFQRAKLRPVSTPVNLVFGHSAHSVVEKYLHGELRADEMKDGFDAAWQQEVLKQTSISYSKTQTKADMVKTGHRLVETFPNWFKSLGIKPKFSELPLAFVLEDGTIVRLVIDFVGEAERTIHDAYGALLAEPGDIVVIDWKTPASASGLPFITQSIQLSLYWLGLNSYATFLGIPEVKAVTFGEGIKSSRPCWSPVEWVGRRQATLEEAIQASLRVAADIREGNFWASSAMAFDSPCESMMGPCDFLEPCMFGTAASVAVPKSTEVIKLIA